MSRILIVEDDPALQTLLGHCLKKQGYTVRVCEHGETAIACIADFQPVLVLLDIQLAGPMNGFECCQAIKALAPDTDVVLLTVLDDSEAIERGFGLGASDFIPKPANMQLVMQRVKRLVQGKLATAELKRTRDREQVLSRIIHQVRRSLDLETTLRTAVTEVRDLLNVDRVVIYRLQGINRIVMEAVSAPHWSIMGREIVDPCLVSTWQPQYIEGRIKAIADIHTPAVQDCHRDLLVSLDVRANLVVPLVHGDQLWGLIIAHHCQDRRTWPTWEMELLQSIGNQIAIAIQQAELYQTIETFNATLQAQVAERTATLVQVLGFEALLKRITQIMRDSLDEGQILAAVQVELRRALNVRECQTNVFDDTNLPSAPPTYAREYSLGCCVANRLSVLVIPIMIAGETPEMLGDLSLIDQPEREFSDLELSLVQQVANQCAIAVRQARLYTAAQKQVLELERLNHLKDDFLSTVSHELRTPLTSMRMSIQMLELTQRDHGFSIKQQEYLRVLRSECQREIALVNDLLELQRLEANPNDGPLDPLDLRPWLEHHLAATQATREIRKLHLKTSGLADLPGYIWASTLRWERIIQELMTNACKYTPSGGSIEISVYWQSSVFTFTIRNTASIPAAELGRVFERFYRIPQLDRWQQGGTGLGLALVKQLVDYLGGSISVSSDHQWTDFTVNLPASLLAESGARPHPLKTV